MEKTINKTSVDNLLAQFVSGDMVEEDQIAAVLMQEDLKVLTTAAQIIRDEQYGSVIS